jgi:tetratricopeptide (TPR) repeat protein
MFTGFKSLSARRAGELEAEYKFDAFLSYAHEDGETVEWLRDLLTSYWVPGKKRRAIFMDRKSMSAGALNELLKRSLKESRYLIVCCSKSARDSSYVDLEVDEFLKSHSVKNVLACLAGPQAIDSRVLPASIERIESQLKDSLFTPDLRGRPARFKGGEFKAAKESALSLLAPLVDLPSKDSILDRRAKRLLIILASVFLLSAISAGIYAGWQWWLRTPSGLRYQALNKVLAATETEEISDTSLIGTVRALGRRGERGSMEKLAGFFRDKDFKALALAAGYASLPQPDCRTAEQLLDGVDRVTARIWPEAMLLAGSRCGGDWVSLAQPETSNPDDLQRWSLALARTGHVDLAQRIKADNSFPVRGALSVDIAIAIAGERPVQTSPKTVSDFLMEDDLYSLLGDILELLEQMDRAGRLKDPLAGTLLDRGLQCALSLDINQSVVWNRYQEMAARLTGAGRDSDAIELLRVEPRRSREGKPEWATGWAWRGLAYGRLGQSQDSLASFAEAERSGSTDIPASRTWSEWKDIALAYVLAGDWKGAFRAAEGPKDERVRILHRCRLIELWSEMGS